ncbi:MAG: aminotransferase class I/II-fold pyridoxal phosphate-dependent enzyme [Pseudomonadota bacterium]
MSLKNEKSLTLATLAARTYLDGLKDNRPLSTSIIRGTIFTAPTATEHARLYREQAKTFYQRFGHPSEDDLADKLAALEGAEGALVFASGMAAISTALLAHLPPGSHVIAGDQIFAQTEEVLRWLSDGRGVEVTFVDPRQLDQLSASFRANTRLVYIETPSNPTLRVTNIAAVCDMASNHGALSFVDSTFATPMAQQPLSLGASLVLHSATKLLGGHMDVMGGVAAGSHDVLSPIAALKRLFGGVLDPQASWLLLRGIKTLHVRTSRIFSSALALAKLLRISPAIKSLYYPLLPTHPDFAVAVEQMRGGGGVITFSFHGGAAAGRQFIDSLDLIQIASSLGGVETVVEMPYDLDWIEKTDSTKTSEVGDEPVDVGLVRLSVGLEDLAELSADLDQALRCVEVRFPA